MYYLSDYIDSERIANDNTKTEDFTNAHENELRIRVEHHDKPSSENRVEEEGLYIVFHGAPKTGKQLFVLHCLL